MVAVAHEPSSSEKWKPDFLHKILLGRELRQDFHGCHIRDGDDGIVDEGLLTWDSQHYSWFQTRIDAYQQTLNNCGGFSLTACEGWLPQQACKHISWANLVVPRHADLASGTSTLQGEKVSAELVPTWSRSTVDGSGSFEEGSYSQRQQEMLVCHFLFSFFVFWSSYAISKHLAF